VRGKQRCICGLLAALTGCGGSGFWTLELSGGSPVEAGIPSSAFEDGCQADWGNFAVLLQERELLGEGGAPAGEIAGAQVYDLVEAGPHWMGQVELAAGAYQGLQLRMAPADAAQGGNVDDAVASGMVTQGASLRVGGSLSCPAGNVFFGWDFQQDVSFDCPTEVEVPSDGEDSSTFLLRGERLFSSDLDDPGAALAGQWLIAADDGDGHLGLEELEELPLDHAIYDGGADEPGSMAEFLRRLVPSLGAMQGGGDCQAGE